MKKIAITRNNQFLGVFEHKSKGVIQNYAAQIAGIPVKDIILKSLKCQIIKDEPHVNQMTIDDFLEDK